MPAALFAFLSALFTSIITFIVDKAIFRIAFKVMLVSLFTGAFFLLVNSLYVSALNALTSFSVNNPQIPGIQSLAYAMPTNIGLALSILAGYEFGVMVFRWALKWLEMKYQILAR